MRRILLSAAAGVVGLALTGAAQAHEPSHHPGPARVYYRDHGHRFSGGYYYIGHDHHHWSRQVWDAHYHRYQYYDPYLRCWYYWYPAGNCYYPVGYGP